VMGWGQSGWTVVKKERLFVLAIVEGAGGGAGHDFILPIMSRCICMSRVIRAWWAGIIALSSQTRDGDHQFEGRVVPRFTISRGKVSEVVTEVPPSKRVRIG
jgi:hypothetical protein